MLNHAGGTAKIRRNELACQIGCAPSQINYVIHTRFNGKTGYFVESRRGGGGGILIKRVDLSKNDYIERILLMADDSLTQQDISVLLNNLMANCMIDQREMLLIQTATSDKFLPDSQPQRNLMRALLFKNMLAILC
jgi:Transcriptional repressor of class III stress genes